MLVRLVSHAGGCEVAPRLPDLPPPLSFAPVDLGGELWLEASITRGCHEHPVFLTPLQHKRLVEFIDTPPRSDAHCLLMPVGTVKSGKTTLLREVLPGLVSAAYATRWPAARPKPVLFHYELDWGASAERCAQGMRLELTAFGDRIGIPFRAHSGGLVGLASAVATFAEEVHAGGGELWLLMDELQASELAAFAPPGDALRCRTEEGAFNRHACMMMLCWPRRGGCCSLAMHDAVAVCWQWAPAPAEHAPHGAGQQLLAVGLRQARCTRPGAISSDGTCHGSRIIACTAALLPGDSLPQVDPGFLVTLLATSGNVSLTSSRPALMAYVMRLISAGNRHWQTHVASRWRRWKSCRSAMLQSHCR